MRASLYDPGASSTDAWTTFQKIELRLEGGGLFHGKKRVTQEQPGMRVDF